MKLTKAMLTAPELKQARCLVADPNQRMGGRVRGSKGANARKNLQGTFQKKKRPLRARRGPILSIFRVLKIEVSLSGAHPVIFRTYRNKRFNYRPRMLRRAILSILEHRPGLTTREIASCCFWFGGPVARPGWRVPNQSELHSTYRAVRRLVAKGKLRHVGRARRMQARRSHKIYSLAEVNEK
jgi:hypothetical protein